MTTPTKKNEPADLFRSMVDKTVADIRKLSTMHLEFYKKLGARVAPLLEAPDRYGNRTVETFCEEIAKNSPTETISASAVYTCVRVWKSIGDEGFDKAISAGMSWRNVLWLGKKSIDDESRGKILDDIVAGKIAQQETRRAVDEAEARISRGGGSGGGGGGSGGGSEDDGKTVDPNALQACKMVKNIPGIFENAQNKIVGYADAVQAVIDENRPADIEATKKHLVAFKEAFECLESAFRREYDEAAKKLAKFK